MDKDLVNVSSSDISEIIVKDPKGKSLKLKRSGKNGNLTLEKLSKKEEMDTSKVSSLV